MGRFGRRGAPLLSGPDFRSKSTTRTVNRPPRRGDDGVACLERWDTTSVARSWSWSLDAPFADSLLTSETSQAPLFPVRILWTGPLVAREGSDSCAPTRLDRRAIKRRTLRTLTGEKRFRRRERRVSAETVSRVEGETYDPLLVKTTDHGCPGRTFGGTFRSPSKRSLFSRPRFEALSYWNSLLLWTRRGRCGEEQDQRRQCSPRNSPSN